MRDSHEDYETLALSAVITWNNCGILYDNSGQINVAGEPSQWPSTGSTTKRANVISNEIANIAHSEARNPTAFNNSRVNKRWPVMKHFIDTSQWKKEKEKEKREWKTCSFERYFISK